MLAVKIRNKLKGYGLSLLLPFIVLMVVFFILDITPFGNRNLLVSDLGTQYYPFLAEFKRFFLTGDFGKSLYSFSNGIGGTMEALSAYYLMSPLNFIILLFSNDQIPVAISCLIILKISLMSLTMYTYLDKHYNQSNLLTQIFALSYSLCGFVVIYLYNFMWLDVLIIFPILVLGIERLWHSQQYGVYAITLFLSIVTNYYLGYMICIFSVGYSVYLYYYNHNTFKKTHRIRQLLSDWKQFFLVSLLTGLATSFMLIPALYGMLQTGKSNFHVDDFLLVPRFGLEALSQMAVGTLNFNIRLDHLPMIYSGILVWLLAFVYFFLPNIPRKKKVAMIILLLFIYCSFFFEMFNTIWHMFQSPAGFPYRNSFIFSFVLIKLAYETSLYARYEQNKNLIKQKIILSGLVYSLLLSLGQLFLNLDSNKEYLVSNRYYIISLIIVWLFVFLIIVGSMRMKRQFQFILLLCVALELGGNLWVSLKNTPFGNQQEYADMYKQQNEVIQYVLGQTKTITRLNHRLPEQNNGYQEVMNGYNNPMLFGYPGVSSYTSTLNATTQDALVDLGLYAKNDRRFSYVDESQLANLLLNVAYTIVPNDMEQKKLLEKKYDMRVYENTEAVGMGFVTDDSLEDLAFEKNKVLTNQENIMQLIYPKTTPFFHELTEIKETIKQDSVVIKGRTTHEGIVYLYFPHVAWKNINDFSINGEQFKSFQYISTNQLFNLGHYRANEDIELTFKTTKPSQIANMELSTLDESDFNQLVSKVKQQKLELTQARNGRLSGEIDVAKGQQLLYLSIPYDDNWQITVDQEQVTPVRVLGDFMGVPLGKGNHKIEMTYVSKPLIVGSIISGIIIIGSLGNILYQRRKKRAK